MKPTRPINKSHVITDSELQPFLGRDNPELFSNRLSAFIKQQCFSWPELRKARESLKESLTKKIFLPDLDVHIQHIPHRIKSSSSRVDRESIENRPCFLCPENLYPKQKGLLYKKEWLILNNPFPIFINHLVVSHHRHFPQLIDKVLATMISFVGDLDFSFTALYNGPSCGASAPDHLHFQACPDGGIPITGQLAKLMHSPAPESPLTIVEENKNGRCFTGAVDTRSLFICITKDPELLFTRLGNVISFLKDTPSAPEEPMVNLIISGAGKHYMGIIFPRTAHRPACYYSHGNDKIIISPGAVDVGGLIILPRKEDYEKIRKEHIPKMFSEVCCCQDIFENLAF
jgi:hypothetical protein